MTTVLDFSPSAPDWNPNWKSMEACFGWIATLNECPQDPIKHAEGDVWTHTKMVCEALVADPNWRILAEPERAVLLAAALLHDIAKPERTREIKNRISTHGHSLHGEILARRMLWSAEVPFHLRERVTGLIRWHELPFFLLEKGDPEHLAFSASYSTRCDQLALLAEADAQGRICRDRQQLLESVAPFSEFCREKRCFDRPRQFPSAHSRFLYFRRESQCAEYEPFVRHQCEMTLMSGLPGAGKDYWLQENANALPTVSLDDIRKVEGAASTGNQGRVVARARELARGHLRAGRSFVWNATNLSRHLRRQCINLAAAYNARVKIVYVEVPKAQLIVQNRSRVEGVSWQVVERLLKRWEIPDLTEAHEVTWYQM